MKKLIKSDFFFPRNFYLALARCVLLHVRTSPKQIEIGKLISRRILLLKSILLKLYRFLSHPKLLL